MAKNENERAPGSAATTMIDGLIAFAAMVTPATTKISTHDNRHHPHLSGTR
jgi:hypothetical protein